MKELNSPEERTHLEVAELKAGVERLVSGMGGHAHNAAQCQGCRQRQWHALLECSSQIHHTKRYHTKGDRCRQGQWHVLLECSSQIHHAKRSHIKGHTLTFGLAAVPSPNHNVLIGHNQWSKVLIGNEQWSKFVIGHEEWNTAVELTPNVQQQQQQKSKARKGASLANEPGSALDSASAPVEGCIQLLLALCQKLTKPT